MQKTPSGHRNGQVLATDLDGTLIPLPDHGRNRADLRVLADQFAHSQVTLVFVTGRHFASVMQVADSFPLPRPMWIICDVGTSLYHRQAAGQYELVDAYRRHLDGIIASMPMATLRDELQPIEGLRLQPAENQGRFKLSYYVDSAQLDRLVARVQQRLDRTSAPYGVIPSVDPFTGDGLVDLLPANVSKAHALDWWTRHVGTASEAVVFAGDSGNDWAALTAGYRAILVGNAASGLAERVEAAHRAAGWNDRLYLARGHATSGVLEGCRQFGLAEPED